MALTLQFNTFRVSPEKNSGSCVCVWETAADIPAVDANAVTLFNNQFTKFNLQSKDWKISERIIYDSVIPTVELQFITEETNSDYSVVSVTPNSYSRRAELKEELKGKDGRGDDKIATFFTYKGIITAWDEENDWSNDPELETPGTNGTKKATEWTFVSYSQSSFMKQVTANKGVTSSIPFDVQKMSPLSIAPGVETKTAFLLKSGSEEYNYFKNYSIKMYKTNAVLWVLLDGSEWEPN